MNATVPLKKQIYGFIICWIFVWHVQGCFCDGFCLVKVVWHFSCESLRRHRQLQMAMKSQKRSETNLQSHTIPCSNSKATKDLKSIAKLKGRKNPHVTNPPTIAAKPHDNRRVDGRKEGGKNKTQGRQVRRGKERRKWKGGWRTRRVIVAPRRA